MRAMVGRGWPVAAEATTHWNDPGVHELCAPNIGTQWSSVFAASQDDFSDPIRAVGDTVLQTPSQKGFAPASRFAVHDVTDLDTASGDALDDKMLAAWAYMIGTGAQICERKSDEVIQLQPAAGGNLCYTERFRGKHHRLANFAHTCSPNWKETTSAADGIDSLHDFKRFLLDQREFKPLAGVISPCPASGTVPRTRYGAVRVVKGATAVPWRGGAPAPAAA